MRYLRDIMAKAFNTAARVHGTPSPRKGYGVWRCALLLTLLLGLGACHPESQTEVLLRAVDDMRVCQRTADNRAFYEHFLRARRAIERIEEEEASLTPDERRRFDSARDEFYLISVTYHYTMGHYDQVKADMEAIDETKLAARDSVQWRHYHFLSSLSAHISNEELAQQAWTLSLYGDSAYWVTEARIHEAAAMNKAGLCLEALDTLQLAYDCIAYDNVPECLCRISEQVSVAYAGLGKKDSSDIYRNIYLDMLEVIRENKELEYRSQLLEQRMAQLRRLSGGFLLLFGLFIVAFAWLAVSVHIRHRRFTKQMDEQYDERTRQFHDELAMHRLRLATYKRDNVRRKASLAIVTSIIPYIDRTRHAIKNVEHFATANEANSLQAQRSITYISELANQMEELNDVLTLWIQTRQGLVNPRMESFAVQELFDMVTRRQRAFAEQGLQLDVTPTDAWVKADRALTLFMLNTLADNARKFTPDGGKVSLSAEVHDDYVELSVADTGIGMSEEDIQEILGHKVYDVSRIGSAGTAHGSGFGLMNCKGIIEKYQKTDSFFAVCRMGIASELGKGSRFWFRLPKVARRALLLLLLLGHVGMGHAQAPQEQLLEAAAAYADSVYYANVGADYEAAIVYADSALRYLNRHQQAAAPDKALAPLTLTGARGGLTETDWWMSDFETDYFTILDIRNELAIAYLALHQLDNYKFNNRSYTELYKLTSEDTTLADYCEQMQQTGRDRLTILVLSLIGVLTFVILWWQLIIRPRRADRRRLQQRNTELERLVSEDGDMRRIRYEENRLHVQNMVLDNCLSAIKHETASYPGRIRQMADRLHADRGSTDTAQQIRDMAELTDFYRDIFGTLAACAAHQLEDITFHRSAVPCADLMQGTKDYLARKTATKGAVCPTLETHHDGSVCDGDAVLLEYLFECLIDESLAAQAQSLSLSAEQKEGFVCFQFTDAGRTLSDEELQGLFYPSRKRIQATSEGAVVGAEFFICRQIVREHDEYFGHVGCRIKAERTTPEGGLTLSFTIPAGKKENGLEVSG